MAKYRYKVNLEKLGVNKYFHFNTALRDELIKSKSEGDRVNFESVTDASNQPKPFERTIAALKEIPEVNNPMSKLEYIY